jgi:hypothetical protein
VAVVLPTNRTIRKRDANGPALNAPRPLLIVLTEIVALIVCVLLLLRLSWSVLSQMSALQAWWLLLPAIIFGYLIADFLSGLVHWFFDSFYREDTPVVGTLMIKGFREHHRDPQKICSHGFMEVNATNSFGVALLLLVELAFRPDASGHPWLLVQVTLITLGLAVFGTNQFHKWAHANRVPAIVAWLQRKNLILSPDRHQIHHRGRHDRGYCITTGWMDWLLDPIEFFPRTEQAIRSVARLTSISRRGQSRRA